MLSGLKGVAGIFVAIIGGNANNIEVKTGPSVVDCQGNLGRGYCQLCTELIEDHHHKISGLDGKLLADVSYLKPCLFKPGTLF